MNSLILTAVVFTLAFQNIVAKQYTNKTKKMHNTYSQHYWDLLQCYSIYVWEGENTTFLLNYYLIL